MLFRGEILSHFQSNSIDVGDGEDTDRLVLLPVMNSQASMRLM